MKRPKPKLDRSILSYTRWLIRLNRNGNLLGTPKDAVFLNGWYYGYAAGIRDAKKSRQK